MGSQRKNAVISILFIVFGGPAILLVYVPFWLTRFRIPADEPRWQLVIAGALIGAGIAPMLESAARFVRVGKGALVPTSATEHLVVSGAYRYVRNPMYAGAVISLAGESIMLRNSGVGAELVLAMIGFHLFVCFYEEPTLKKRYGEEYAEYKRNVPQWLPRLTPWKGRS
jgi:protein-S-isoprenylcysteine O-methyltransferase Ste14